MVGKSRPARAAFAVLVTLACTPSVLASTVCYYPNGDIAPTYQPCSSTSGGAAACCELSSSACSTTGYCYGSAGVMYRGGCTDQSFNSLSCPSRCSDVNRQSFSNINLCPEQSGNNLFTCSGSGTFTLDLCLTNFSFAAGVPFTPSSTTLQSTSSSTTTTASSTGLSTGTSSATSSPTSTAAAQDSCASTLTAGLATGIPLGVIAAFLAVVVFWQHRRYSKQLTGTTGAPSSYGAPPHGSAWGTQSTPSTYQAQPYYEPNPATWEPKPPQVPPAPPPSEMPTPSPLHELR